MKLTLCEVKPIYIYFGYATLQAKVNEVGSASYKDCCLACKLGLGISMANGADKQAQTCKQVII